MRLRFSILAALMLYAAAAAASDTVAGAGKLTDDSRLASAAVAEFLRLRESEPAPRATAVGTKADSSVSKNTSAPVKRSAGLAKLRTRLASVERKRIRDSYREQQLKLITARRAAADSTGAASAATVAAEAD